MNTREQSLITSDEEREYTSERKEIVDYTLYAISKRRQRRMVYQRSMIFALLIFVLSVTAGGFAFVLFDRYREGALSGFVDMLASSPFAADGVKDFTRQLLSRYMCLEIFMLLHFAFGFTPATQWTSAVLLLLGSGFSGFYISYFAKVIFSAAMFSGTFVLIYLTSIIFLSLFCVLNIFMASIACSFHGAVRIAKETSVPVREEEVGEFIHYFLNISALTLLLTLLSSLLFWIARV